MISLAEIGAQLTVNTLARWAVYTILALGFGVLYRALRVFHVSYAALIVLPSFLADTLLHIGVPSWAAMLTALASNVAIATVLDRVLYSPLDRRGAGPEGGMIASLGTYSLLQSLIGVAFGYALLRVALLPDAVGRSGWVVMGVAQALQFLLGLVSVAAFYALERSRLGLQLRAIGNNPRLLDLYGAASGRLRAWAWTWAASLAAVAGLAIAGDTGIDSRTGMQLFLTASVAVFLGGVEKPLGWILAALVLSIAENTASLGLEAKWAPTVTYALALALLALRTRGLRTLAHRPGQLHG